MEEKKGKVTGHQVIGTLTKEMFDKIPYGEIINQGVELNQPGKLYMTDNRIGDQLFWVAKKGGGDDWAIYCDFIEKTKEQVLSNGQKIIDRENITKLVPCTDEIFNCYRL